MIGYIGDSSLGNCSSRNVECLLCGYKLAIINNSAFIACLHNHPSGDPEASYEDKKLTERLQRAGAILGISVIDHIIVGDTDYYSFRDGGELDEE